MVDVETNMRAVEADMEVLEVLFVALAASLRGAAPGMAEAVERCFATAEDILTARAMATATEQERQARLYGLRGLDDLRRLVGGEPLASRPS